MLGVKSIRIRRGSQVFHVHGQNAGAEGVWLAHGQVEGIYDAPVKTTYKSGAFQVGSRQRARKYLHRDMMLGFHIKDTASLWEFNDSEFRRMFDYELDRWALVDVPTTIEFETELSGTRKLDVLLWDTPDFNPKVDPAQNQHSNLILPLRAGQPLWYSDDYISTFTSSGTSGSGTVTVQNLTDQEAHHKWVLTPAVWSLPDREWVGDRGARTTSGSRTVSGITVTTENGGAVVDRDLNELMFRDANNTNILAQLAGKFFEYSIPPYTPAQTLPVSYSGAPGGGASAQLRVPQRWSRPCGMEIPVEAPE